MIPLRVLQEMFEYNYWARDLQLRACTGLTDEQFLRPLGSSFASLRDTTVHLFWAEWLWLERWLGRSPTKREAEDFATSRFPNVRAIEDRWRTTEHDARHYLSGLTEDKLIRPLTYTNLQGEKWIYPLWQTLFHVINHQTYHRGQITTMLRQLGAQPPQIDFLVAKDVGFRR